MLLTMLPTILTLARPVEKPSIMLGRIASICLHESLKATIYFYIAKPFLHKNVYQCLKSNAASKKGPGYVILAS